MKRGSSLRRHVRLARVSATVRRQRPEFDAVYRVVDARSGGRCEAFGFEVAGGVALARCPARAREHHHTRKPRRAAENHRPEFIIHLCRRHHDLTTASYRTGRLRITPLGEGAFTCAVVQKDSKWA